MSKRATHVKRKIENKAKTGIPSVGETGIAQLESELESPSSSIAVLEAEFNEVPGADIFGVESLMNGSLSVRVWGRGWYYLLLAKNL